MANNGQYVTIGQVVDLVGLQSRPGQPRDGISIDVQCPFCGRESKRPQYKLNIDLAHDVYRCNRCGESGNAIDLYGRLVHGERCIPGRNSKELYKKLCEDVHQPNHRVAAKPQQSTQPQYKEIKRAADEVVNRTYQALLDMPEFALTTEHHQNLLKRGMTEETIRRNGYRSFTRDALRAIGRGGNAKREICKRLLDHGCQLEGVPGFYRKDGVWFIVYEEGMVIPTRNEERQIVSLQVRKATGNIRYKTLSSKYYGGVNSGISRAHFPLGNAQFGPRTMVLLTEGPLKADVTIDLLRQHGYSNVAMIAVQGVNNTADLEGIFCRLRERGVKRVRNALDMDKLTNKNVAKASKAIKKIAHRAKLGMPVLIWGYEDAQNKLIELEDTCMRNGINSRARSADVFLQIAWMARKIPDEIMHDHDSWPDTSKGIDDYCRSYFVTPA